MKKNLLVIEVRDANNRVLFSNDFDRATTFDLFNSIDRVFGSESAEGNGRVRAMKDGAPLLELGLYEGKASYLVEKLKKMSNR